MWADRASPAEVARCAAALAGVVPGGGPGMQLREPLPAGAEPEFLARALLRSPGDVWLDDPVSGRHLMAWSAPVILEARGPRVVMHHAEGSDEVDDDLFTFLAALSTTAVAAELTPRLFGFLGYELGAQLEDVPARRSPVADAMLGLHDLWLEGHGSAWELVSAGVWHDREAMCTVRDRILAALAAPSAEPATVSAEPPTPSAEPSMVPETAGWSVEPDDAAFEAAVGRTVDRIAAGEIFQTNLCRRFTAEAPGVDPLRLYLQMRCRNPARHGAYVELGEAAILSMSPESFLRCDRGDVVSEPIKGTRPRADEPALDAAVAEELLASDKDRAELAMIVDLVRNDLGRVCEPGSVRVLEHARLMELPTVIHTCSRVGGRLRADRDWADLLRATFPPGSITGAPKIQAMIVAAEEEPGARGPAMGSIGWIAQSGDMDLSVAIRTALVHAGRAVYHAGCGIVAASDPSAERLETVAKARAFLQVLER